MNFPIQISGNTINDTVTSYLEAEEKCHSEGSRLLQLRSLEQLKALTNTRADHFGPSGIHVEQVFRGNLLLG